MRLDYYAIYRELTATYEALFTAGKLPRPLFAGYRRPRIALRMVSEVVDRTVANLQLGARLRPDARHFLLINLHQMVALPLTLSTIDLSPPQPTVLSKKDMESMRKDLESDATEVLRAANEESYGSEISGHDILNAISRVYQRLRTTRLEIWG